MIRNHLLCSFNKKIINKHQKVNIIMCKTEKGYVSRAFVDHGIKMTTSYFLFHFNDKKKIGALTVMIAGSRGLCDHATNYILSKI